MMADGRIEMTTRLAVLCAASIIVAGCEQAEDKCGGSDAKYYGPALEYQLTKAGVPYRAMPDGMVCVAPKHAAEFAAAEGRVDQYFHAVAHKLKDSCEEHAFAEWATNENLRFDIRDAFDPGGRPSGKLFLIRSFTAEEVVSNADML